jgi:SAM-dependent methyltransferase
MRLADNAQTPVAGDYLFGHAGREARTRLETLAAIYDPGTFRHLEARGLERGWSCLEVGAGGGSVAAWLCDRVGPAGQVLATDLDVRFLETLPHPNLRVWRHNIVSDALPEGAFDLVHARLVLMHLPRPEPALARMIAALKPGGWLVAEEFDAHATRPDIRINPAEAMTKSNMALRLVVRRHGVDLSYGRKLTARLGACGLADVGAEGRTFMWHGRSPGTSLLRANYEQLRGLMLESGLITEAEMEQDLARLDDPELVFPSPILWAAWGRRPGAPHRQATDLTGGAA